MCQPEAMFTSTVTENDSPPRTVRLSVRIVTVTGDSGFGAWSGGSVGFCAGVEVGAVGFAAAAGATGAAAASGAAFLLVACTTASCRTVDGPVWSHAAKDRQAATVTTLWSGLRNASFMLLNPWKCHPLLRDSTNGTSAALAQKIELRCRVTG